MWVIDRYIEYYRDNPKGYWFKRKLYGWGWVPVRWQGWLVTISATMLMLGIGFYMDSNPSKEKIYFSSLILGVVVFKLLLIAYKTGESPKWQWGPEKRGKR